MEEEDHEAMQNELKEAFRLYDKEGCLKKVHFLACSKLKRQLLIN